MLTATKGGASPWSASFEGTVPDVAQGSSPDGPCCIFVQAEAVDCGTSLLGLSPLSSFPGL